MSTSIKQRLGAAHLDQLSEREVRAVLASVLTDLRAIKTNVAGLTAKLDADAGVTDANYTALWSDTLVLNTTD